MAFFQSAIATLQTLTVALGAGLGAWGVINLMEGYGNDNPGAKSQGIKQLTANQLEKNSRALIEADWCRIVFKERKAGPGAFVR